MRLLIVATAIIVTASAAAGASKCQGRYAGTLGGTVARFGPPASMWAMPGAFHVYFAQADEKTGKENGLFDNVEFDINSKFVRCTVSKHAETSDPSTD